MSRAKFRYIPHTADVSFIAYGSSFNRALENAALAMLDTMFDVKKIEKSAGPTKKLRIRDSAATREELVWFTLQDILSNIDEKSLKAFRFDVKKIENSKGKIHLAGEVSHKKVSENFSLLEVKAVTPSGLRVDSSKRGWSIRVLLDV